MSTKNQSQFWVSATVVLLLISAFLVSAGFTSFSPDEGESQSYILTVTPNVMGLKVSGNLTTSEGLERVERDGEHKFNTEADLLTYVRQAYNVKVVQWQRSIQGNVNQYIYYLETE